MRALWLSDELPARHLKADREYDDIFVESIRRVLARTPNGERLTGSEIKASLYLSDSLVELAFRLDPHGDESTLAAERSITTGHRLRVARVSAPRAVRPRHTGPGGHA